MKKLVYFVFLFVVACSSSKGKLDKINGPDWIFDPYAVKTNDKTEVAAVGVSEKTAGGLRMQIAQAEADARVNLANQISSFMARVTRDAMSKHEAVLKQEDIKKQFIQISEQSVRDVNLAFSNRTHIWQSPDDDTLFVRIAMPRANADKAMDDTWRNYQEKLKDKNFVAIVDQIRNEISSASNFGVVNYSATGIVAPAVESK
ncbi:MAG: hypothetical protein RL208_23 [Pseudomonadota bacterium]|jgi:hypothetical protein